jgi:ribosomal protein L18E
MLVWRSVYHDALKKWGESTDEVARLKGELSKMETELRVLHKEAESERQSAKYWRKVAEDEREYYRQRTEAENPHNLERLKAIMDLTDDDEPPVPGAVPRSSFMERINEIHGDGLSVDEMIRRRKAYEEAQES